MAVQEKILPFVPVSEAVQLPEEQESQRAVAEELSRLHEGRSSAQDAGVQVRSPSAAPLLACRCAAASIERTRTTAHLVLVGTAAGEWNRCGLGHVWCPVLVAHSGGTYAEYLGDRAARIGRIEPYVVDLHGQHRDSTGTQNVLTPWRTMRHANSAVAACPAQQLSSGEAAMHHS